MNKQKGFTIIELIVVVAIIAVLAAIVLVNVTAQINKGRNAAIMANLRSVATSGTAYFEANGNYTNFCTSAGMTVPNVAANVDSGGTALPMCTITAWCDCSPLRLTTAEPVGSTFCVDSTGYRKVTQNAGLCATRCPATGGCVD